MTFFKLALASLRHYWRSSLFLLTGVFLASAILTGALSVGDSVRESLRHQGMLRVGQVETAIIGGERFFTQSLHQPTEDGLVTSAGILVYGSATSHGGKVRANGVQVLGVDASFWKLGEQPMDAPQGIGINDALAKRLSVSTGDSIYVRVEPRSLLSRDAPLSGRSDETKTLRLKIDQIISDQHMGRFGLRADQEAPLSVYLPLQRLAKAIDQEGRANLLLANHRIAPPEVQWSLADASLKLETDTFSGELLLSSDRVQIDDIFATKVGDAGRVFTYMANRIFHGENSVPYSIASGIEAVSEGKTAITQWLADALGVGIGDQISLEYYGLGLGREVVVKQSPTYEIERILPMDDPMVHRGWTPKFPGISNVDKLSEWDPGVPINEEWIMDRDEDYWDTYKETPKMFINVDDAQTLWSNRFGSLTSLRFENKNLTEENLRDRLKIDADAFGLQFRYPREDAEAAAANSYDFGMLFAALSFFLIAAALTLAALLFAFGVEQRSSEIGVMLAIGIKKSQVRRSFLLQSAILAFFGALLGVLGGILYTRLALWGLGAVWQDAVNGMEFRYAAKPATIIAGVFAAFILAMVVVYFVSRRLTKIDPKTLISGVSERSIATQDRPFWKTASFWTLLILGLTGIGLVISTRTAPADQQGPIFSGAGMALLVAGIAGLSLFLHRYRNGFGTASDLGAIGRRNSVRRIGRSLAVAGTMAAGVYLVTSINANRLTPDNSWEERHSGTGGFRFVAESSLPIYENLNTRKGRELYALDDYSSAQLEFVQFRVHEGDEASCLNLNRAQQPRLLGVDPKELSDRDAFRFMKTTAAPGESSWDLLQAPDQDRIPAIIDFNSATYALQVGLGDSVTYTDEKGESLNVTIVALVAPSILQGSVIISEANFIKKFPSAGGYRSFLLDAPTGKEGDQIGKEVTRMLSDRGLEVISAADRLNTFNQVQNTYLSIFSVLGGLGVLLGTVGLAIVVGLNVLERRGELALMQSIGFRKSAIERIVLSEHWFLHLAGVLLGFGCAMVAIVPIALKPGSEFPLLLTLQILGAIWLAGMVFCWIATKVALRENLQSALRSE